MQKKEYKENKKVAIRRPKRNIGSRMGKNDSRRRAEVEMCRRKSRRKSKKLAIRYRKGIEGSRMGESGSGDVQKRNRGEQKWVEGQ